MHCKAALAAVACLAASTIFVTPAQAQPYPGGYYGYRVYQPYYGYGPRFYYGGPRYGYGYPYGFRFSYGYPYRYGYRPGFYGYRYR